MYWKRAKKGNAYAKTGNLVPIITTVAVPEEHNLIIKVDFPFLSEEEAKQYAEEVVALLEDEGLAHVEDWTE